jgi:uncharacterized repeat protein (TIGR04076 family)
MERRIGKRGKTRVSRHGDDHEREGASQLRHKAGDRIELSSYSSGGLCGFLYHDIFPYVIMLQFGGGFPADWSDPDVIHMECMDKFNLVIELKRIREK